MHWTEAEGRDELWLLLGLGSTLLLLRVNECTVTNWPLKRCFILLRSCHWIQLFRARGQVTGEDKFLIFHSGSWRTADKNPLSCWFYYLCNRTADGNARSYDWVGWMEKGTGQSSYGKRGCNAFFALHWTFFDLFVCHARLDYNSRT